MNTHICRLCKSQMTYFARARKRDYYRCSQCDSIQMDPASMLNTKDEKARYDQHNNDVFDLGYQRFVRPIINYIKGNFSPEDKGLDFGAGPGPVIAKVLKENDYQIALYDPHFYPHVELLKKTYDYIFACEVIEHFNDPKHAFDTLYHMSNTNTQWIFMTALYDDSIDFSQWHYKNDETHVIFYTKKTIDYIKTLYKWQHIHIDGRLIIFHN